MVRKRKVICLAIGFSLGAVNVNSQNTNCVIAIGENQLNGYAAHRKVNNGIGFLSGNVLNQANVTSVFDPDGVDSLMNSLNFSPAVQNQAL